MADSIPPTVQQYLVRGALTGARVVPLTGDASDRRYFRLLAPGRDPLVLAVHAEPFDLATLPFANVAALFRAMPVPVPAIVDHADDLGILVLEDLGDVTLQAHLGTTLAHEHAELYRRAVDLVVTMQRRGRDLADDAYLPYRVVFDEEKFTWELNYFVRHFLEHYRAVVFETDERLVLDRELQTMAEELAAEPRVLCHRDYHSRNLMVHGGELAIIDFQDARLGPDTYDLASLLRDAYVEIPEPQIESLLTEYLRATHRMAEAAAFRQRFELMTLQRTLKALGTFGFQTTARQNPVYIQYIPRALQHARRALHSSHRFSRLAEVLAAHVPELR